ncbi:unnamed protein product [Dovyalis caffra]|uniref:Transposase n=1 Tax=Dovyalis caffra TaxID=77055 RepID=A0AAV1SUT2_9ROSI|nr:unnamed protein product [Dovyalis caffra]
MVKGERPHNLKYNEITVSNMVKKIGIRFKPNKAVWRYRKMANAVERQKVKEWKSLFPQKLSNKIAQKSVEKSFSSFNDTIALKIEQREQEECGHRAVGSQLDYVS